MKKLDLQLSGKRYESAYKILKTLKDNSFNAYIVGGAVRDALLGNSVKEYDLVTDARPDEIKKLFRKTVLVGEQFGVVIVNDYGYNIELATFRKDLNYKDARHPDRVLYTTDIKEDVIRRDFTVNALYYNAFTNEILDFVGGLEDLNNKVIKAVGEPLDRLKEDRLRILRACRFSAQLGFTLDKTVKDAILSLGNIDKDIFVGISAERKRDELIKILKTKQPSIAFNLMKELNLLRDFLPELEKLIGVEQPKNYHPEGDVWNHTMLAIDIASQKNCSLRCRLAVLFHDLGKPDTISYEDRIRFNKHDVIGARITKELMSRLKFSNKDIEQVTYMVKNHMKIGAFDRLRKSKRKLLMAEDTFKDEILLNLADSLASHGDATMYDFLKQEYKEFTKEQKLPKPIVTGKFLIKHGYKPSPKFSKVIKEAYILQLEGKLNTEEEALRVIKGLKIF